MKAGVSDTVIDDVVRFRYKERFRFTEAQMADEPDDAIQRAFFIWELDNQRVKLEETKQSPM